MIFSLCLSIYGLIKSFPSEGAKIDDYPFRLFYVFTTGVLFFCTSLLGLQDAFGKNIICYSLEGFGNALDQYCWVSGTKPRHFDCKAADPTVKEFYKDKGCYCHDSHWVHSYDQSSCEDNLVHGYYQWVPYMLFLQGCLFFLPRVFWTSNEEGKMEGISKGVLAGMKPDENYETRVSNVAKNVSKYIRMKEAGHYKYGMSYLIAQGLNLGIVVLVIWLTNMFLDGEFFLLGIKWITALTDNTKASSMVLESIFPRTTSCSFFRAGSDGTQGNTEHLCVLAPNALSEKIFIFLWFWYGLLAVIACFNFILIIAMALRSSFIRKMYLARAVWTGKVRFDFRQNEEWDKKLGSMEFGQFLFLYLLGRNVDYNVYKKVLLDVMESGKRVLELGLELGQIDATSSSGLETLKLPTCPKLPVYTDVDGTEEEINSQKKECE